MYRYFFKRFFDILLSLIAIVILSPLYLIIVVCVRIWMGSPILFSQERIGKGGENIQDV
ncbi:sugar transferase [Bacteroides faecis]|nr:sugar transferase [Bacteroides faecis]MCS2481084.1 sugar transferase [Bacteroides faecis]